MFPTDDKNENLLKGGQERNQQGKDMEVKPVRRIYRPDACISREEGRVELGP